MLAVRLLEMPLAELEQSVNMEIDDNPALETISPNDALNDEQGYGDGTTDSSDSTFEEEQEREERQDALDSALERLGGDDELPVNYAYATPHNADYEEMVYGDTTSFYDKLKEQMVEQELTEDERQVMEYLIGSLDNDGYLRKDLDQISDELAIYHNIDIPVKEIEKVLHCLQTFEPAGIGARTLQECLLLQVDRRMEENPTSATLPLVKRLLQHHFEAFTKKHWQRIRSSMHLTEDQLEDVTREIRRLNPKPGTSLGEAMGRSLQQITPDFIVDTDDEGNVSFYLNRGDIPELTVSPSFAEMVETYRNNREGMSTSAKEALLYAKEKVDRAQGFIEAVRNRRNTLITTMKAIVNWQYRYFQDGDEADLRPMILKDIANETGLDISTISRVTGMKYAQTRWGTFPLRHFFSDGYTTDKGEELSTRKIKVALRELIESEDKHHPLSDDALMRKMQEKGYPIARRTVAKYREQMGLPVARLRKE